MQTHDNGDQHGDQHGDQPFGKVIHKEEYKQQPVQTYLTHYNCARPFEVVIREKEHGFAVEVYKVEFERCWEGKTRSKLVFDGVVPRVFVARESDVPEAIKLYEGFDHEDGHVVVLELTPDKSVYIGESVYMFKTLAKLERMESYIGSNDVPYPCMIDEEGNVYLLFYEKIITHAGLGGLKDSGEYDDYYELYDDGKIEPDKLRAMEIKVIEEHEEHS
jgi:hypothetical protein